MRTLQLNASATTCGLRPINCSRCIEVSRGITIRVKSVDKKTRTFFLDISNRLTLPELYFFFHWVSIDVPGLFTKYQRTLNSKLAIGSNHTIEKYNRVHTFISTITIFKVLHWLLLTCTAPKSKKVYN